MVNFNKKAQLLSSDQDNNTNIECINKYGNNIPCDNDIDNLFDINNTRNELQSHDRKICIKPKNNIENSYTLYDCENNTDSDNYYLISSFDKKKYNCLTKQDDKITSSDCSDTDEKQLWKNHKKNKSKIHNITDETKCLKKKDDYYYLENCDNNDNDNNDNNDNNSVISTCSEEDDDIKKIVKKISINGKLNSYEIDRIIIDNTRDTYSCQNYDKIKTKIIKYLNNQNKYKEHFFNFDKKLFDIDNIFFNSDKTIENFININKISLIDIFWLLLYVLILNSLFKRLKNKYETGFNFLMIIQLLSFIFFMRLSVNLLFYIINNANSSNKSDRLSKFNLSNNANKSNKSNRSNKLNLSKRHSI